MKNTLLLLLFTFLFFTDVSAQGWEKSYDFAEDTAVEILQTNAGETYFLHNQTVNDTSLTILLSQIDTNGNLLNTLEFSSDSLRLSASSFSQTADGGFIIGATGKNSDNSRFYGVLIKLMPDGTEEWRQLYSSYYDKFVIQDVLESSTGGYIVVGQIITYGDFFVVMKTDSAGNELWINSRSVYTNLQTCGIVTCIGADLLDQITEINPNLFLITGSLLEVDVINNNTETVYYTRGYWLTIDSLGNKISDIVRSDNKGFQDLKQLADGNFITTYRISYYQHAVEKLNATGSRLWQFNLPDSLMMSKMSIAPNGDIIVAGRTYISSVESDYTLIRYSEAGTQLWRRDYAYYNNNILKSAIFDDSENSWLLGHSSSDQFSDIFIVKTDAEGNAKTNKINGFTFYDQNNNCIYDEDDYPLENYQINIEQLPNYQIFTDENGQFSTLVNSGVNTISTVPIDSAWVACTPVIYHDFSMLNDSIYVEFAIRDTCPEISSDIFLNPICGDGNGEAYISSSGGVGSFSYTWSNGETGTSISGLETGNYSVTVNSGTCGTIENFEYDFLDSYIHTPIRNYGGSRPDSPKEIMHLSDGGYLLTGTSLSNDNDVSGHHGTTNQYDFWFVRLDEDRNIVWEQNYGGTGKEEYGQTIRLANGNFLTVGHTWSENGDVSEFNEKSAGWIFEIDENGQLIREKSFGGSSWDYFYTVAEMSDGSLVVGGSTYSDDGDLSENNGIYDMWILRLDADWNTLWSESIGGSKEDRIEKVRIGEDDRIFVGAMVKSQNGDIIPSSTVTNTTYDIWLAEINTLDGAVVWQKHISSNRDDIFDDIYMEEDKISVIVLARANQDFSTENISENTSRIWLLKYSTAGTPLSPPKAIGRANENYSSIGGSQRKEDGGFFILSRANTTTSYENSLYELDVNGEEEQKVRLSQTLPNYFSIKNDSLMTCIARGRNEQSVDNFDYLLWEMELGYADINLFGRDTTLCIGDAITLDFADLQTIDNNYLWLNDSTDNPLTIVVQEDTLVTALVTSPEGCQGLAKTFIYAYDFAIETTVFEPNCGIENGAIELDINFSNQGAVIYQWSNGATTRDLEDIPNGTYSVTATDSNCSIYEEYELDYTETPAAVDDVYIENLVAPNLVAPTFRGFEYDKERFLFLQRRNNKARLMSRPGFYEAVFDYADIFEMCPLADERIVIGGMTETDSIVLIDVSSNGIGLGTHRFGGSATDYLYDIKELENGDFIICGSTNSTDGDFSNNEGEFDAYIMRLDADFNPIWTRTFGGSLIDIFYETAVLSDGTIVACGNSQSTDGDLPTNLGGKDRIMVLFDPAGNLQSTHVYGGSDDDHCRVVRVTEEDEIILFGTSNSNDGDVVEGAGTWVMKVNNAGEILWNISTSTSGNGNGDVEITIDNKVVFTSNPGAISACDLEDGHLIWQKVGNGYWIESNEEADIFLHKSFVQSLYYPDGTYQASSYNHYVDILRFAETPPPFTLPADTLLCTGDSLIIQMESPIGFDFHWSNGTIGDSVLITEPGLHSAELVSYANCKTSDSILLDLCEDFSLNSPDPQCYEIEMNAGFAGADYLWSTGDTTYSTIVTDSSWVSLQMTHPDGTIYVDSVFVPVVIDDIIIDPLHNSEICAGDGSSLIDLTITSSLPYEVNWNNGATTEDLISPVPGFYSVLVSNEFGCTEGDYFSIENTPENTGTISETPVDCHDGNDGIIHFTMTSGQEPYGYLWNTGEIGTSLVGVPAGLYSVSVTDFMGCEISEFIFLVNPTELEVTAEINQPTAGNSNGSITLTPSGGNPNYYIVWEDGTLSFTRENLSEGWYSATITDENGCENESSYYLGKPVSIKENSNIDFKLFPNPFSDNLTIELDDIENAEVSIFDILGRKIQFSNSSILENKLVLDTEKWISGTYLVQVKIGEKTTTKRIVK